MAGPAQGIQSPHGLARDKFGLLFANDAAGKIQHYHLTTGALTDIVPGVNGPRGIATYNDTLFWIEAGTDKIFSSSSGEMATIPGAAGTLFDLVVVPAGFGQAVYVTSRDRVYRIEDNSPLPSFVGTVHTGTANSFFSGITSTPDRVFFNSRGENKVYEVPLTPAPASVLHDTTSVPGLNKPFGIGVTPGPRISLNDPVVNEASEEVTFTVSLSVPTSCEVEVTYFTSDRSALAPFDYTETSGTIAIPAGATAGPVVVPIANDGLFEPDETFRLLLSVASFGEITDGLGTATILSQGTVAGSRKHTWGQNVGWTNWKPVTGIGPEASGAHTLATFLTGKIWNQNVGWINLGNGAPDNGASYSNTSATDFGVNLQPDGSLTGRAWGQNIGWITFEQTRGRPRLDYATGRFSGHAWSQNCGWLNLGSTHFLQTDLLEILDEDNDMIDDAWELGHGAANLTVLTKSGDADGDGESDFAEFLAGTDPFDPSDSLKLLDVSVSPGVPQWNVDLTWTSSPARLYDVHESPDLASPFTSVLTGIPGAGDTTTSTLSRPLPLDPDHFWRIEARRPLLP